MSIVTTAFFYVLVHGIMSSGTGEMERSVAYHFLMPEGRGTDIACLYTGGNRAQVLEGLTERNLAVFFAVEEALEEYMESTDGEVHLEDVFRFLIDTCGGIAEHYVTDEDEELADRIAEIPKQQLSDRYQQWQPVPAAEPAHRMVGRLVGCLTENSKDN